MCVLGVGFCICLRKCWLFFFELKEDAIGGKAMKNCLNYFEFCDLLCLVWEFGGVVDFER